MKRFAKVMAFTVLAALLLGAAAPAAYAETRRVDVTVAASDVNFFSFAYYFDSRKNQLDYLKKVTVAVQVGGDKLAEAVLDGYATSRRLVLVTEKKGDITIKLNFAWRDGSGPSQKEYAYTNMGQVITLDSADIAQRLPGFKCKTLMDPFSR